MKHPTFQAGPGPSWPNGPRSATRGGGRRRGAVLLVAAWLCTPAWFLGAGSFSLTTRVVEIAERGEVTLSVLRSEGRELTFFSPAGWRSQLDAAAGTLTFTAPDYASVLRLKVTLSGSGQGPILQPDELRQAARQEMPAATLSEEFTCHAACGSGPGFDLIRAQPGQPSSSGRVGFVPFPGGRAKVVLTCPTSQFRQRQHDLTAFLNSLQAQ